MKVGILAVQGDYEAHGEMLARLGIGYCFVKTSEDLQGCDALILPGGESTTQLQFLQEEGLIAGIRALAERGGSLFGTCAGAILLANEVRNPTQPSLELLDIAITRNGYGRQLSSEVRLGTSKLAGRASSEMTTPETAVAGAPAPMEMVFIRAPIIERVGPGVEILAESEGKPVLVRQGKVLAATFHPELTTDTTVHGAFLKIASEHQQRAQSANTTPDSPSKSVSKQITTPHEVLL
ncbi:MAG TPA: pyridoxal 5'-phosphate synthase glutaminase subunit PdxT [Candidatus Dormibacteraeota bacterium]|nr:pyridoxal 5'-phosphate synthase glutaminase subunit PdxT [Candidatus Dormibacteraeota bacterium]